MSSCYVPAAGGEGAKSAVHARVPGLFAKVAVEILDVNDHAPRFPTRRIQHRLAESADPQSSGIVLPSAADPDAGRNAVRKYEIVSSAADKFVLEARQTADGGTDLRLLLRQQLDRETEDR